MRLVSALLLVAGGLGVLAAPASADPGSADLEVTVFFQHTPVVAGAVEPFSLQVINNGPSDNLGLSAELQTSPALDPYAGVPDGCEATTEGLSCSANGLASGDVVTWSGNFLIPHDMAAGSSIDLLATVASTFVDTPDPFPDNNEYETLWPVTRSADLAVGQEHTPDPVKAGAPMMFTVSVLNMGPSDADNVSAFDTLPAGTQVLDAHADQGTGCAPEGDPWVIDCSLGTIPIGFAATITLSVRAPDDPGSRTNSVLVHTTDNDPNGSNDGSADGITVEQGTADVSVAGQASASSVTADQLVSFDFTVSNDGPDPATHPQLTVSFDRLVIVQSASHLCFYTDVLHCSLDTIQAGDATVVEFQAYPIDPGHVTGHAAVSTASDDQEGSNDATDLQLTVLPQSRTRYVDVTDHGFAPPKVTAKQGDTVQWNFPYDQVTGHSATDPTQMHLFESGLMNAVFLYQYRFSAAGRYRVRDAQAGFDGVVRVPLKVKPDAGGVSTGFKLTWSIGAPFDGFVFDVQVKRPGTNTWVYWKNDTTLWNANFIPDGGPGAYQFRSRLRKVSNGAASGWSAAKTITVS